MENRWKYASDANRCNNDANFKEQKQEVMGIMNEYFRENSNVFDWELGAEPPKDKRLQDYVTEMVHHIADGTDFEIADVVHEVVQQVNTKANEVGESLNKDDPWTAVVFDEYYERKISGALDNLYEIKGNKDKADDIGEIK